MSLVSRLLMRAIVKGMIEYLEKRIEEVRRSEGQLEGRLNEVEGTVYDKDYDFAKGDKGVIKEYKGDDGRIRIPEMIQGEWVQVLETNWESGSWRPPKFTHFFRTLDIDNQN